MDSFDGDGLSDTPPDPFHQSHSVQSGSRALSSRERKSSLIAETSWDTWNNRSKVLSRQQVEIVKNGSVQRRLQSGMLLSANLAWKSPLEAETLEYSRATRRPYQCGMHGTVRRG